VETSLLATKLLIPPERPGLVSRPRLTERMRAALTCSLMLISAPAGFGKTTVVSQWARQNKDRCRIGWVSLDEGDNDPVRFWGYFIASFKTLGTATGESASSMLQFSQRYSTEPVLTALINDLAAVPEEFAVVLDDYHLIKSEVVHDSLTFMIKHIPSRMHIVIATRADPPLPLAHYRGHGAMLEIGADDLRFTLEEATTLLRGLPDVQLAADDVSALNVRAEGWAAGLKLAALSLGQRKDVKSFINNFSGSQRYVMDYLMEEVLRSQPAEVENFLLKTSVLERLSASLCDAVTERSGCANLLKRLESSFGGFLVPLDESRRWYRYHHLFAGLLRNQSEAAFGVPEINIIHRRASRWYEENGFTDDAVNHALAAHDIEGAVRLIGTVAETLNKKGERATLLGWLNQIPNDVVQSDPSLYVQYAYALVTFGRVESAEAALAYLEHTAQDDTALQGKVATLQAIMQERQGNIPRVVELADKALSLLPPDELLHRCLANYLVGFVQYFLGFLDKASPRLIEAHKTGQQVENYYVAAASLNFLAGITRHRGKLHEALDMAKRALEIAGQNPAAAVPHNMLCVISYELDDLEAAAEHARLSVEWTHRGGNAEAHVAGHLYEAQIYLARGDVALAAKAMEDSWEVARDLTLSPFFRARNAIGRVIFAIRQDDLDTAKEWGRRLLEFADVFPFEFAHVPARLLIALGKKEAAAEELRGLYHRAIRVDAQGLIIAIRVYQALAAATQSEALDYLTKALVKGEPEGYIRSFVDEGRLLAPLLRSAMARGVTPEYTAHLLNIIRTEERRQPGVVGVASHYSSRLLSEREIEIVRFMEAGLSNLQIAGKLIVTVGTVKAHVYNIMHKLNAQNRTQAVARARELRLL
jgi:LuxR family transcriptional regulator, maltose regulon positive regulatory protein